VTPERWQQVKNTLAAALERPDEDARAAFVANACGDDTALRREVESLLAQSEDQFESVAEAIGVASPPSNTSTDAGRSIGQYELVREIGRGGMGAVWLARRADRQFEKVVAIKLLKRGTDTDEVLRRFQTERQILARLEHPNIARLLDGGITDDDLPYFVMEYVEGRPVTDFCRDHALTIEERLRLFLKICGAVQFAHQNLVVHRDLKPGNILVTVEGEPKLLDFGIAKLLAADDAFVSVTVSEHQRLTPAYASPEQVRGEPITTAIDVYSLGTLLYEILTGQNAHRFSVPHPPPTELLRVVAQEEPLRPSVAAANSKIEIGNSKLLKGDLDNIVLKALRKEPARRYNSVGLLAEDVRRHLENRTVTARPDTLGYRLSKFIQRNKLGVAAATLVLLTLIGGLVGIAWQARIAGQRFNDVRRLAHSVLFDYHDAIANLPGSTAVRKKLVTDSLQYLDSLAKMSGRDESLQHEIAAAYLKIGDVQGRPYFPSLGDMPAAAASYSKAVELFDALAAHEPGDVALQTERSTASERLSEVSREQGRLDASLAAARKSIAIIEAIPPPNRTADAREALSLAYLTLADVTGNPFIQNLGDPTTALDYYQRALAIREELVVAEPKNLTRATAASVAHSRIAAILWARKDSAGALEHYKKGLAMDESVLAADPNNVVSQRSLGITLSLIVPILLETGDVAGARSTLSRSISLNEQVANADPQNAAAKTDLAITYSRMVAIMGKSGDLAGTHQYFDKALELYSLQLAKDPNNQTPSMMIRAHYARMADALLDLGRAEEALGYSTKGVEAADRVISLASRPDTRRFKAHSLVQRAKIHALLAEDARKQPAEQEQNWEAARADYEETIKLLDTIPKESALPMDKAKRDEASAGLVKCDAALGRVPK
jgi:eukaryotic-like serine/threonine-protein kinase